MEITLENKIFNESVIEIHQIIILFQISQTVFTYVRVGCIKLK